MSHEQTRNYTKSFQSVKSMGDYAKVTLIFRACSCLFVAKKLLLKKGLATISIIILAFAACKKSGDSELGIFDSDETKEVIDIITDANADLKQVKAIYKANENRVGELKEAITAKDIDKVKTIANDLVLQINDGLVLGESAVSKIEKAERMNINDTYKSYLSLKRDSLGKQLEAFELRRKSAQILSKELNSNDTEGFKKAAIILKVNEEEFQKLMEEGKQLSQEANQIAKDASRRR